MLWHWVMILKNVFNGKHKTVEGKNKLDTADEAEEDLKSYLEQQETFHDDEWIVVDAYVEGE